MASLCHSWCLNHFFSSCFGCFGSYGACYSYCFISSWKTPFKLQLLLYISQACVSGLCSWESGSYCHSSPCILHHAISHRLANRWYGRLQKEPQFSVTTYLQCDFVASFIKRWSLFLYHLNLTWPRQIGQWNFSNHDPIRGFKEHLCNGAEHKTLRSPCEWAHTSLMEVNRSTLVNSLPTARDVTKALQDHPAPADCSYVSEPK